jgi:hypothetical protein
MSEFEGERPYVKNSGDGKLPFIGDKVIAAMIHNQEFEEVAEYAVDKGLTLRCLMDFCVNRGNSNPIPKYDLLEIGDLMLKLERARIK